MKTLQFEGKILEYQKMKINGQYSLQKILQMQLVI